MSTPSTPSTLGRTRSASTAYFLPLKMLKNDRTWMGHCAMDFGSVKRKSIPQRLHLSRTVSNHQWSWTPKTRTTFDGHTFDFTSTIESLPMQQSLDKVVLVVHYGRRCVATTRRWGVGTTARAEAVGVCAPRAMPRPAGSSANHWRIFLRRAAEGCPTTCRCVAAASGRRRGRAAHRTTGQCFFWPVLAPAPAPGRRQQPRGPLGRSRSRSGCAFYPLPAKNTLPKR